MSTIAGNLFFFGPSILAVLAAKFLSLRQGTYAWRMSAFLRVAFHVSFSIQQESVKLSGGYLRDRNYEDH
jgi:hypothetical protein